ncbi:LysR family transcriptional regulator [Corynebacterium tuberculostearicum]|uniref:LysR family transcriptional regulator n=1 Tax=Corynebacterium tuberculostearicum TaxID=38304 RepID=UPI002934828D|nr:LysR family transcriptional regulator [Corynebacterium tuberculostearicum]MDV2427664.1 LysR family transcriptional regulator [Corynebacterium tuberculostearicum]
MDTRQLLYFRAVVDHGSFTHAAESLDMTQPSLSLSIRKLEKELNAQLLSRGRSGVSTTEAGDYVYKTAVKVDALLSETQRHISEITGDKASTVSLASGAILNWEFTPAALAELKRIYPTANISLDDAEPATAIKHLLDGQVDLALLPTSDPKAFIRRYSPELTVHQVAMFDYSVALPQRLAELESPVSLADLKKETWLVPPRSRELPELAEFYHDLWNSRPSLKPEKPQEVASLNSAIPMVSSGLGVSIVPNCAPTVQPHGIITRPIADDLPRYYAIVAYRTDRELTAAAQDLVDILRTPQRTLA